MLDKDASQKWLPRERILKSYLDSLSPPELLKARPDYWALRFAAGVGRALGIKNNYDPSQLRDDLGRWADSGGNSKRPAAFALDKFAGRRRGNEAECDAQYKLDSAICRMVRTSLRWEQAMKRRAACISGYPLPPLNF